MITESIYVTLGAGQLKEKNYRTQINNFLISDGEKAIFFWSLHTRPKNDFVNVFIVIGNKVRWKARFVDWEKPGEVTFLDGHSRKADNWMMLIDFEPLPKPHKKMKGFQGFRYNYTSHDN